MGFSGIPLAEQAQYAATEYAPAVANLKAQGAQKELSFQESLQQLGRDKRTQAQGIFDNEQNRALQQRQFDESIRQYNETLKFQREQAAAQERQARAASAAAAASDISKYFSGAGASSAAAAPKQGAGVANVPYTNKYTQNIISRVQSVIDVAKTDKALAGSLYNRLIKGDAASKEVAARLMQTADYKKLMGLR